MVKRNRLNTYNTIGGGVAIFIRESAGINYTPFTDLTAPDNKCTDIIQAKVKWNGRDIVVTSLYNPPVSSRPRDLQGFLAEYTLSACARQGLNHIICGKFNAHSITWDSAEDVVESEEGAEIEELLRENSATLENTGDSKLRHSNTRKRSAVDLSIHMGDVIIRTGEPSRPSASLTTQPSPSTSGETISQTRGRELASGLLHEKQNLLWKSGLDEI